MKYRVLKMINGKKYFLKLESGLAIWKPESHKSESDLFDKNYAKAISQMNKNLSLEIEKG